MEEKMKTIRGRLKEAQDDINVMWMCIEPIEVIKLGTECFFRLSCKRV